ncbi:MAG: aminotransferase class I/II-fold pyridoxal phosphate-dependent enzyme [Turicibacter sp.]|nr:aminotransferase class I/II-fold pyridoxal phosphate-dependent enzyme [Turicibacter sp.]
MDQMAIKKPMAKKPMAEARKKMHQKLPLMDALKNYTQKDVAAFDVPGHKRGQGVPVLQDFFGEKLMKMDVNSLPELDNVSNATGVIKEAMELLADAYGADAAYFMTNGTTGAIHSMLLAALEPGDEVLLPRNIHKSALNGLILCGAKPVYVKADILPKENLVGNLTARDVEMHLLDNPKIKAVFVLNPTYYGFVSDLKAIASVCNRHGVLLMVDEAHGAHLGFHDGLPLSAMEAGADMSCVSIHKTGGALTQASALLVKKNKINPKKVQQVVNMLQSTSASYLLMGSLDGARQNLVLNGHRQLTEALRLSSLARFELNRIPGVHTVESPDGRLDITKLGINVRGLGLSGFEVYDLMHQNYGIQLEMPDFNHVLAIISLGDEERNIWRLIDAFKEISKKQAATPTKINMKPMRPLGTPKVALSPRQAYFSEKAPLLLDAAIGRIAGESVMAYPPGIPLVAPGEEITAEIVVTLKQLKQSQAFMTDSYDPDLKQILVIKEESDPYA